MSTQNYSFKQFLWDLFCASSIVGIWPRFIEPRLLMTTRLNIGIAKLPAALSGLKILHISDLHFNSSLSPSFCEKIIRKSKEFNADIIVCTGDFLCYGNMPEPLRLLELLQQLKATYGCYAVAGNHDYTPSISVNSSGDYDTISSLTESSSIRQAFTRLFSSLKLTRKVTSRAKEAPISADLIALLKKTPFQLLNNSTTTIEINGVRLNLTGLGEYTAGRTDIQLAFSQYDLKSPGIILLHNPDGISLLKDSPGDIILCGHTHGGQINLPWIWKKFTLLENLKWSKGLFKVYEKRVYVTRGIGGVIPFRMFSPPELNLMTLSADYA